MELLKTAAAVIAATDIGPGPRDPEGRRREFTAEELDALVEPGWRWPDVRRFVAAMKTAALPRSQASADPAVDPALLAQ